METRTRTQQGTWARRLGGGALLLALVGVLTPALMHAATNTNDNTDAPPINVPGETVIITGTAPSGGTPSPSPIGAGGYTGGSSSSGGGTNTGAGGGGGADSGNSPPSQTATDAERLLAAMENCLAGVGEWGWGFWKDPRTQQTRSGYQCRETENLDGSVTTLYYDKRGYQRMKCTEWPPTPDHGTITACSY